MTINPEYHTLGKFIADAVPLVDVRGEELKARAEELKAAYERIEKLEADLEECSEYFKDHCDVVDGDYGEPAPNKEMRLYSMIQETLHGLGAF